MTLQYSLKEEMEDALVTYSLKLTKEEIGDKLKYQEMKNVDIRKPQKFLQEINLEECFIAMRVKCTVEKKEYFSQLSAAVKIDLGFEI